MKINILLVFLISFVINGMAQTAVNFTCNDCNGISHDLFTECDSGNVIVLCWVMPCGACTGGALTCSSVCQSFPSKVKMYLCDDYANTNCTSLSSWAAQNNITNTAAFSNTAIRMSDYGTAGMPKTVVIGGSNHTVFYNANNTFNGTAIQNAINQALSANSINEQSLFLSSASIFPTPVKDASTIKFNLEKPSLVTIDLFNLDGKKLKEVFSGKSNAGENNITLNLESYPNGMYLIKLTENDKSQFLNVEVIH